MVPEGCLSQLAELYQHYNFFMVIKFNGEECCHDSVSNEELPTKCKKATALLYNKNTHKFNSINVGVVWGIVMLIGGMVITGCGLSLKQSWKRWSQWSLTYSPTPPPPPPPPPSPQNEHQWFSVESLQWL